MKACPVPTPRSKGPKIRIRITKKLPGNTLDRGKKNGRRLPASSGSAAASEI